MNYTDVSERNNAAVMDDAEKRARLAEIERLVRRVESRQGGSGDYTKEKQERSSEEVDALCAAFERWVVKRREAGL